MRNLSSRLQQEPGLALALIALGLALALALAASASAAGDKAKGCDRASSRPTIVKIHADWCGSCRATAAVWERIENEFGDEAQIVRFDVTDRIGHDAAKAEAAALGLDDFFQEYRRRTGVIAFLASGADSPTTILAGERDFEKYRAALDTTLDLGTGKVLGGAADCAAQ